MSLRPSFLRFKWMCNWWCASRRCQRRSEIKVRTMDLNQLTKMYDFTGKSVVITGGAGILGGEIACALVGCGANVAIMDRDPPPAGRFMYRIEAGCGQEIV